MRVLLVSGGAHATSQTMLEVVHELRELGAHVDLAMWTPPPQALLEAVDSAVVWGRAKGLPSGPVTRTFPTGRGAHVKRQAVRVLNRLRRTGQAGRAWRRVRRDPALLSRAARADVIVAVDTQAVRTAWQLAQRLPQPAVVYGLSAGRGVIVRRLSSSTC